MKGKQLYSPAFSHHPMIASAQPKNGPLSPLRAKENIHTRHSVLIIDDDEGTCRSLALVFGTRGYVPDIAHTGHEAIQKVRARNFDVALVDVRLPDLDGTEVLRELKEVAPDLEVVMITGFVSLESAIQAVNDKAFAYVRKPLDIEHVLATIEKAIERRRLAIENRRMLQDLTVLNEISAAISQSLNLERVLNTALDKTIHALGMEVGMVLLLNQDRSSLDVVAYRNLATIQAELHSRKLPAGWNGAWRAVSEGRVVMAEEESVSEPLAELLPGETPVIHSVAAPLMANGNVLGVIELAGRGKRHFTEHDSRLLTAIGQQIGVALDNARLYEGLRAAYDQLQQTQAHLLQSEKLSALGELVSGIAHELNNPLTVIIGYAQLLQSSESRSEIEHGLHKIHYEAQRLTKMVSNLLTFARQHQEDDRTEVDLNEVVQRVLELRTYAGRQKGIALEADLQPDLSRVWGDASQLQQVLLNLVINAEQAIMQTRDSGHIVIRTYRADNGMIRLEVKDDGPGIPVHLQGRIFDPFFTTKPPGMGTGLGLSICYGIVNAHQGRIRVDSEPGKGATFIVELLAAEEPLAEEGPTFYAATTRIEENRQAKEAGGEAKRALVVDDEPTITDLLVRVLEEQGCDVDVAGEASLARQYLGETAYDLVVCDLRLPGMSGQGLYEWVRQARPELESRIVFCSGDTLNPSTRLFLAQTGRPWLRKPFQLREVQALITQVLNPVPT